MEFEFHTHPVTFCIIRNFYSEDEIGLVHEELERLLIRHRLFECAIQP